MQSNFNKNLNENQMCVLFRNTQVVLVNFVSFSNKLSNLSTELRARVRSGKARARILGLAFKQNLAKMSAFRNCTMLKFKPLLMTS